MGFGLGLELYYIIVKWCNWDIVFYIGMFIGYYVYVVVEEGIVFWYYENVKFVGSLYDLLLLFVLGLIVIFD